MAYIQREGGERFIIPSYRDVISKRKSQLKDDILELSSKYGEYLTFQRRGLAQFEVAFSHEPGYLFGECIWTYFKNPKDLIYCEAIPDTEEAYLVIVKNGSVYLDGSFPVENIQEELLIFTTQKNDFDIYTYGEVPISPEPMDGKFSFDPSSIKSYTILDGPLFEHLPTVRAYQLQLVDVVLRQQGIGIFPVKYVIAVAVILGLAWMGYSYVNLHEKRMPRVAAAPPPPDPYLNFNRSLDTPSPSGEIRAVIVTLARLLTLPGWVMTDLNYSAGTINANLKSLGAPTAALLDWAAKNQIQVKLTGKGFTLTAAVNLPPTRGTPTVIYPIELVLSNLIDRVALVMPGNVLNVLPPANRSVYQESTVTISLADVSPETVIILSEQLKGMPLVLTSMSLRINHGLTGSISLQALGS